MIVEDFVKKTTKSMMNETDYNPDTIRNNMPGYVGNDFAKVAEDADLAEMAKLKNQKSKIYNGQILPLINQMNALRKKYKLSPIKG